MKAIEIVGWILLAVLLLMETGAMLEGRMQPAIAYGIAAAGVVLIIGRARQ